MNDHPIRHLNQVELARRWSLSHRTLERWRWEGRGPAYLKIGGRVVYRLGDIESYEAEQFHQPVDPVAEVYRTGSPKLRRQP
jgi:hypothetical protein